MIFEGSEKARSNRSLACLIVILFVIGSGLFARGAAAAKPFTIDDYFKIKQVTELSLSSDGSTVAYAVERQSLDENKIVRDIAIRLTAPDSVDLFVDDIQDARSLAWTRGRDNDNLAFLSARNGSMQVYSYDPKRRKLRTHTKSKIKVSEYRFSPDGKSLAFLAQAEPSLDAASYDESEHKGRFDQLHHGEEGVVVDSEHTSLYDFVNPNWPDITQRPENKLWLKTGKRTKPINIPGRVKAFRWSHDGTKLSILYVADTTANNAFFEKYTSLGVYDLQTMAFRELAAARPGVDLGDGVYFAGGEWVPEAGLLHVRRIVENDAWTNNTYWSVIDPDEGPIDVSGAKWRAIEHGAADELLATGPRRYYVKKTVRAVDALFELTDHGLEWAEMIRDVSGAAKDFQFSADYQTGAFVNQNLTTLPEIFIWREGEGSRALTRLNAAIADKRMPAAREVTWKGADGATIHGWLLTPSGAKKKPWPLVTLVHGGPSIPLRNAFSYYWFGGLWPYPFEVYALKDMAVFLPNYRGTRTYGDDFGDPETIDGEPLDDIQTGIEHLIEIGVADPERLGISGHSHGSWLGPLVMTRSKSFRAASFAEGPSNMIVNYSLMPGFLNRITHDPIFGKGESLYDNYHRYLEISPSIDFKGLDTAVLFEAGVHSLAVAMMGDPKAAHRAGMPAEFVVYPQTGHNIQLPRLKYESAERNLDWFRFWLLDLEDPDPKKAEQYDRWRNMRNARCANKVLKTPIYCDSSDIVLGL